MPPFILLVIFFAFAILLIIVASYLFLRARKSKQKYLQDLSELVPEGVSFEFLGFEALEFKEIKLNQLLAKSLDSQLESLYFVHGTFVGEDPFHFFELINDLMPHQLQGITEKMKGLTKFGQDIFMRDMANFTHRHRDKMASFLPGVQVKNFVWSSGNHHTARIRGALKLVRELSVVHKSGDRILLLGHSHAAQVFALLTQIIYMEGLEDILKEHFTSEVDFKKLNKNKIKLQKMKIDFVTFGSPPRYEWIPHENVRILHFINHRLPGPQAGNLSGILTTRDGDYIQQIGLTGSDFISPIDRENRMNKELDIYFGEGVNRQELRRLYQKKQRLHNLGHHLLVDYGDHSKIPNFALTMFGHGIYTKIDLLDFHFEQIAKKFYKGS